MTDDVQKYCDRWKLSGVAEFAETFTARLYRADSADGEVVLKVFNKFGRLDEAPGAYFLQNDFGSGVVRLLEYDAGAQLLEHLPGPDLVALSASGLEDKATEVFIGIIQQIHGVDPIRHRSKMRSVRSLYAVFDRVAVPDPLKPRIGRAQELAEYLDNTQETEALLHGDLHHENILQDRDGHYRCIDPKGFIGDPAFELGPILANPVACPEVS